MEKPKLNEDDDEEEPKIQTFIIGDIQIGNSTGIKNPIGVVNKILKNKNIKKYLNFYQIKQQKVSYID